VPASDRFAAATSAVVRALPWGLAAVVAPSLVGYLLVNSVTFSLDLGLLTVLHGALRWPLAISISIGYLLACGVGFVLNRWLNFRSHGRLGRQSLRYGAVVGLNYLMCILGVGDGLARAGVDYRLSRIVAAACEAIFMYCAMRWFVFERARRSGPETVCPIGDVSS
jgi:putative flippase GtrA